MGATVTLRELVEPLMTETKYPQELVHMLARKISVREGYPWGTTLRAEDAAAMAEEIRANFARNTAAHKLQTAAKRAARKAEKA